jgi:hypothetical protein
VHEIQRHVRTYAAQHGLNPNDEPITDDANFAASYGTKVESLRKVNGAWKLQLRKSEKVDYPPRIKTTWGEEDFDAVVVASGGYDAPHVPSIAGLKEWSDVKDDQGRYKVWHGQSYRHPEPLKGKVRGARFVVRGDADPRLSCSWAHLYPPWASPTTSARTSRSSTSQSDRATAEARL